MAELLVDGLLEEGRPPDAAFTVAELRRSLLPYPRCREALGLASKAEYDLALLRLLDAGGLLEGDAPELDEDVERELASPEPGLGVLDDHASVALRPGPALRRRLREGAGAGGPEASAGSAPSAAEPADRGDGGAGSAVSRPDDGPSASGACASCGGGLPDLEGLQYCPHCGAAVGTPRCRGCGKELEAGWRHCPFCGRERHD